MTLFDLVLRSMRKNLKLYYLYFFALISSVVMYFVFATLQHTPVIVEQGGNSMTTSFQIAGVLVLLIAGIFVVYANAIFLTRRSQEIGLFQLIGLQKNTVAKILAAENLLLGAGALVIGIAVGLLVSRVFLLLLLKLIGLETIIELTFSATAIIQTIALFFVIFLLTTIQMVFTVYRSSLLALFSSQKKGEHPKQPSTAKSAVLALLGAGLIGFSYWLSTQMLNEQLFLNMFLVLAAIIPGTYLIFRVTISWVLYKIRKRHDGHLGLVNSLSLAPLMHRMKGNANSLTAITILSAMTLTMIAVSYSYYYATEKETGAMMPFDFMFEDDAAGADEISRELEESGIAYERGIMETVVAVGGFENGALPVSSSPYDMRLSVVSDEALRQAGIDIDAPASGTASFHTTSSASLFIDAVSLPVNIHFNDDNETAVSVTEVGDGNVINWSSFTSQLVVDEATYSQLKASLAGEDVALQRIDGFHITDEEQVAAASAIYQQGKYTSRGPHVDYYSSYQEALQANGMLIFIAGFLGLVFLISTGSILYFKQMTEAEQEKKSYETLRQLGFSVGEIMRGIIRKQLFVFGLPLIVGLVHSLFAINVASYFFQTDIAVPTIIALAAYTLIYLMFAFLTVGYYRKVVKAAL
ncbi:FtsX-like permease family protein [Planomicrobium sp. YIM 101495]|uniref:FtsX-like permease family protein n=1 Tax=Planomicrobium sp. YIM 101495 TaxID=2665160 RepID=UPI0012B9E223|nr:FtsX-like permease family protein [Planomicrobium sp. YIM 101495]MTD29479.1 FtsX-like permease family protein [Planomicrobium sp. YIM 101495]